MAPNLRIITWNANGLIRRQHELEHFLHSEKIDVALISETHLTPRTFVRIRGFNLLSCPHPGNRSRGGVAILLRSHIPYFESARIQLESYQVLGITVQFPSHALTLASIYCPPRFRLTCNDFSSIFSQLGARFILGGDFNSKHTFWGSRLNNPKGRELFKAISANNIEIATSRKPTYWPTDSNKLPDLLDFYLLRGMPISHIWVENILDLTSDHVPVLLTLNSSIVQRPAKQLLYNKSTDWDRFREIINTQLQIHRPQSKNDIDTLVEAFTTLLQTAAKEATPQLPSMVRVVTFPDKIRGLVALKRKARRTWHRTRLPRDKTTLNKLTRDLTRRISDYKNQEFRRFVSQLDSTAKSDYTLWKACRRIRSPQTQTPPLRSPTGGWARSDEEVAAVFANHLCSTFMPNDMPTQLQCNPVPTDYAEPIGSFSPKEVTSEIIQYAKKKKAPGCDLLTSQLLRELPHKAVLQLTAIFNAVLEFRYFPSAWKRANVIMICKPDKAKDIPSSYRPISLLPVLGKLFEKLLLRKLEPLIDQNNLIPSFQFGFRRKHSTIDQALSVFQKAGAALENRQFCCAVFLDVAQAFDKVWHQGLLHKLQLILPLSYCQLLQSYLTNRQFRVQSGSTHSAWNPVQAGVPQGSVLGPILYVLYTADIPVSSTVSNSVFADDTALLSTSENLAEATQAVQGHLDHVFDWADRWKIRLNPTKSAHINFTMSHSPDLPLFARGEKIPTKEEVKYLGLHFDRRLTWAAHIKAKCELLRRKTKSYYWLLGPRSTLSLENKRLLYLSVLKPIWLYGLQLWGTASASNIQKMQQQQNVILRTISSAHRYTRNEDIHRDLQIPPVPDEISRLKDKYELRLHSHVNPSVLELLDNSLSYRRLKRPRYLF